MIFIFTASSDAQSSQHSTHLLLPLLHRLFPGMTPDQLETLHYAFRKTCHVGEYAVLALLLWNTIRHWRELSSQRWHWDAAGLALALVFLYAASDEIHQAFVPSRTAQISDVIVDTCGGIFGLALLWLAGKFSKRW